MSRNGQASAEYFSRCRKGKVLVIGAGVIGLTTAVTLAEQGYRITILSRDFVACDSGSKLTSQAGPALWTVCSIPGCESKLKSWCMHGYHKFSKLAEDSTHTGIYMTERVWMYPHKIASIPASKALMDNFKGLPGFRYSTELIKEKGVSMDCSFIDAMSVQVPAIEVDLFLLWLTQQCILKGVDFHKGSVDSLLQNCESLKRKYDVDFIVNCTGISAGKLVQDDAVYPMLGVGLLLHNDDRTFHYPPNCALTDESTYWHQEETGTSGFVFIAPRGEHSLWMGTLKLATYDKNINIQHPAVQRMLQECQAVYPPLKSIDQSLLRPTVGIRPMRSGGPCVEQDVRYPFLIHNYGHAAYGVVLSWGTAEQVARIMDESRTSKL